MTVQLKQLYHYVDFLKVLFFCMNAGKDFSHLQRAKFTGRFFDRGVSGGVFIF